MDAPMYLIGAKKTDMAKIRFVFMIPVEGNPNVMEGNGALLEVTDFRDIIVAGNTPLKSSLLEAFVETMVEGDEQNEAKGPLPCGIAIAGDEVQLVGYWDASPLIKCHGRLFTFMANIDMADFHKENDA